MKYLVTLYQPEMHQYTWLVEAGSEQEAADFALSGEGELIGGPEYAFRLDDPSRGVSEIRVM